MDKKFETPEEEMTVEITLEDDSVVECIVITILAVNNKDYICVTPMVDEDDDQYGEVWIYGY